MVAELEASIKHSGQASEQAERQANIQAAAKDEHIRVLEASLASTRSRLAGALAEAEEERMSLSAQVDSLEQKVVVARENVAVISRLEAEVADLKLLLRKVYGLYLLRYSRCSVLLFAILALLPDSILWYRV